MGEEKELFSISLFIWHWSNCLKSIEKPRLLTAIEVHSSQHLEVPVSHDVNTFISIISGCQFAYVSWMKLSKWCCLCTWKLWKNMKVVTFTKLECEPLTHLWCSLCNVYFYCRKFSIKWMCRINFCQSMCASMLSGGLALLCSKSFISSKLKPKVCSQISYLDSSALAK